MARHFKPVCDSSDRSVRTLISYVLHREKMKKIMKVAYRADIDILTHEQSYHSGKYTSELEIVVEYDGGTGFLFSRYFTADYSKVTLKKGRSFQALCFRDEVASLFRAKPSKGFFRYQLRFVK